LETYKELLVNTLDLLSFLLVTPELVATMRSTIGDVLRAIFYTIIAVAWLALVAGAVVLAGWLIVYRFPAIIIEFAAMFLGLLGAAALSFPRLANAFGIFEPADRFFNKGPSSRSLFVAGLITFFATRIVSMGFAVSSILQHHE
jgi:hypothetical protein